MVHRIDLQITTSNELNNWMDFKNLQKQVCRKWIAKATAFAWLADFIRNPFLPVLSGDSWLKKANQEMQEGLVVMGMGVFILVFGALIIRVIEGNWITYVSNFATDKVSGN